MYYEIAGTTNIIEILGIRSGLEHGEILCFRPKYNNTSSVVIKINGIGKSLIYEDFELPPGLLITTKDIFIRFDKYGNCFKIIKL